MNEKQSEYETKVNNTSFFITKCSSKFKASDALGSLCLKAKLHFPALHGEELDHAFMVPNHHLKGSFCSSHSLGELGNLVKYKAFLSKFLLGVETGSSSALPFYIFPFSKKKLI